MGNKVSKIFKSKYFTIVEGAIALAAIGALIAVLAMNATKKTETFSATFIANTDPKKEGKIQGSESKKFDNITKLDAPYSTDVLPNYTFDYWCSDEELTKPVTFPYSLNKNETFYAHWTFLQPISYIVTFNTDGGTIVGETSVTKGESISRPEVSKPHCELKAWHENNKEGKEIFKKISEKDEYEKYTPSGNVILFAEWAQTEFNVGLDLNGGSFTEHDSFKDVVIGGETYKGYEYTKNISSAPFPVKANSSFQGWYTSSLCNEESFVKFPLEVKSDMVLYAKWVDEKELPTLTIDANGGYLPQISGESEDPQTRKIKTNLLPYSPTAYYLKEHKDQYNLLGWFDSNDKKVDFPLNITTDTTIKAKWEKVRFNATIYATEKGIEKKRILNSWEDLALCRYADIPNPKEGDKDLSEFKEGSSSKKIDNYVLDKWEIYKIVDNKEEYVEEQEAGKLDINPLNYDANIYAKWKQNKYNITLHNGETSEVLESQTQESIGSSGPSIPSGWVKDHEVFSGWYSDKECKNKIDFSTYELTKDDNFYFKSDLAQGKVYLHTSYDKNSSTYNGTEDYYYTEDYKGLGAGFAARDLPDKEHYKKLGWTYTESNYTGDFPDPSTSNEIYSKDATEESGKIKPWPSDGIRPKAGKIAHLYPTYEQSEFEISFSVGEKATACNPIWTEAKDKDGNAYISTKTTIPDTSKSFSEFKGWSLTEGGEVISKDDLRKHPFTKDTVLYAIFETNAWTVTFNILKGNDGYTNYSEGLKQEGLKSLSSGSLSDVRKSLEADTTLKRNNATLAGFRTSKPTNDADTYDISSIITELTIDKDTVLYGVYYKTDYQLTINLNGATIKDKTGIAEVKFNVSNEPVSDKNVWYSKVLESSGGTEIIAPSSLPTFYGFAIKGTTNLIEFPYTVETDLELDMIWVNNSKFMVTFDAGNGDFYYKQNDIVRTTPIISYEVDKDDTSIWKEGYTTTLKNVYDQARIKRNCLNEDYLVNDGYVFKAWKYSGVELDDSYVISTSRGFDASYTRETKTNWWDDSTGLIISYAEDTSTPSKSSYKTVLEETYNDEFTGTKITKNGPDDEKEPNTFVGLEKEISIKTLSTEYTFTTRVIGESQDILSDGTKKAYLTIQFIDAPISGCYASDSNKDPRYENSIIKNSTIPYLLESIPNTLTSHFQSVNKIYLSGDSAESTSCTTMKSSAESLFLLSAYELGGKTGSGGSAYYEEIYRGSYSPFAYSYYSNLGDGSKSEIITKRAFTYPYNSSEKTININAWTRTPKGAYSPKGETNQDVYFVGCNTGNINLGAMCCWDPMSGFGVCPAFCIGTRPLS